MKGDYRYPMEADGRRVGKYPVWFIMEDRPLKARRMVAGDNADRILQSIPSEVESPLGKILSATRERHPGSRCHILWRTLLEQKKADREALKKFTEFDFLRKRRPHSDRSKQHGPSRRENLPAPDVRHNQR